MLSSKTIDRARRRLPALAWRIFGVAAVCGAAAIGACGGDGNQGGGKPADFTVEAVSTRADLVSGGDVLVRATLPAGWKIEQATLALNGAPIAAPFHPAPDGKGWLALVKGLNLGGNSLTLSANAYVAKLDMTNHPNGGPIFSGPQIKPWFCQDGATDKETCDRPTTIEYRYMPAGQTAFQSYDPGSPPPAGAIQQVTTQSGVTVPYVVRVETLTQNRSQVSFAVLFDPSKPWTPWAPQAQWNKGVHVLQGSGCGTGYGEMAPGPYSVLNDYALKKGYIVVVAALLHNTINCNQIVQAESVVMAKEHIAETYGLWDIIFGMGTSGGAISQLEDQNAYPGLYDGLVLGLTFIDSDASRLTSYDCKVVYDYWAKAGTLAYTNEQKQRIVGMISGCDSQVNTTRYQVYNPSVGTDCVLIKGESATSAATAALKYDALTNPSGVRCTLQDYQVNQVGRRPDGFANGRVDTEGVQFGLRALLGGEISPAQFVEMNENIGGHDIDFNRLSVRTVADRAGLKPMYETGISNVANNLADTPILDRRTEALDFHQTFFAYMTRARLDKAQGHHDNHVLWRTLGSADPAGFANSSFDTMEAWIKAIKADTRKVPMAQKVKENKPAMARDRCTDASGQDLPPDSCARPLELPRVLAGAPDTNFGGKCQLKPLNPADYAPIVFTESEWARLQATFPTGVCDYSREYVDFAQTIAWLAYDGKGYKPLPPPPVSYGGKGGS